MLLFNARSVRGRDSIAELSFLCSTNTEAVFCITESFLKPHDNDGIFAKITCTHNVLRSDRTNSAGGGVLFLIPKKFSFSVQFKLASDVIEAACVDQYIF